MLGWTKWAIALAVAGLCHVRRLRPLLPASRRCRAAARPSRCRSAPRSAAQADAARSQRSRPRLRICDALLASRRLRGRHLDARAHADLSRRTRRASSSSSASSITNSAPTKWRAAISSRRSPIQACRPRSPPRSASISSSSRSPPTRRPSPPRSSRRIRWESNANAGPGTQSMTLNGIDFTLDQQSVGSCRLERAQHRHHALRLGSEESGRPHRVRRARLQRPPISISSTISTSISSS